MSPASPVDTVRTGPLRLFRGVAIAEAVTWALLLTGMFVKYTGDAVFGHSTEVGVQVAGPIHGVVFIAYVLTTILVGIDQRWSVGRLALGLVSSIPPFATVVFDRYAERRGALSGSWRLVAEEPAGPVERMAAWLIRNPLRGAITGLVAVAVLTGLALVAG